ncbi:MAG: hypothetical protein ABSG62_18215 [Terracidiphilus sp.]
MRVEEDPQIAPGKGVERSFDLRLEFGDLTTFVVEPGVANPDNSRIP